MKQKVLESFAEHFGGEGDIRTYFAPGRVNLIGEHTDYNGGHVFPCALTIGTYMAARKREDRKLRFYSMNFEHLGVIESSLDDFKMGKEGNWTAYPKGMIWTFIKKGYPVEQGMDVVIYGNIPNGSGLSSSASVEVVTGVMLRDLFGYDQLTNTDLALFGQYSENNYNGVNCGIMDQFAVAMGKKDCAIFLDTSDLSYEYAPVKLEKVSNIGSLGELTVEAFEEIQSAIQDPVRVKRARHAVAENQRTIEAVKALKANDIKTFGELMNASHVSLRDDYEVTGIELDTLVEEAWKCPGVIGSRMTGAGFGGCTVSIVENDAIDNFIEKVGAAYKEKIGYAADFYVVDIGPGAGVLE